MGTRAVASLHRRGLAVLSLSALAACSTPDPQQVVTLKLKSTRSPDGLKAIAITTIQAKV